MPLKTEIYFRRVLGPRSLRSEGHNQPLVWTGFLACRLQHLTESHCESEMGRRRERTSLLKSPHFCWLRTSSLTTSLNLTYLLRTPSPDAVTWAVRAAHMNSREIQSSPEPQTEKLWGWTVSEFELFFFFQNSLVVQLRLPCFHCWAWKFAATSQEHAGICGLQRRWIRSRARDEAWSLGAFCVAKFY